MYDDDIHYYGSSYSHSKYSRSCSRAVRCGHQLLRYSHGSLVVRKP
jgi:hypothetical protein